MTTRTTITLEQADEIIMNSQYESGLDGEFEIHDLGYVYGLETGGAVVVTFSGKMIESEKLDAALSMLNTSEHFEDWDGTVDLNDDGIVFGMSDGSEVLVLDVLCRYEVDAQVLNADLNCTNYGTGSRLQLEDEGFFTWMFDGNVEDEPENSDGLPFRYTAQEEWN